jgi:hypothetical protein
VEERGATAHEIRLREGVLLQETTITFVTWALPDIVMEFRAGRSP